ncbi:hypothetical protein ACFFJT_00475 [Dyella flava]|uniref:Uncharacterized protein n=1 Tax=Dyella flava TaxID=1920170 RepID=A0ABS2JYW6_9GAMM|nr:hypothetical protein [Dyella flava]MBM7124206.1 hypothetical protein [Dyella flava]GLQ50516.1 hypothetical protein GCM10010872_19650 [Dyella flava]
MMTTPTHAFITPRHIRADGTKETLTTRRVPYKCMQPMGNIRRVRSQTLTYHMVQIDGRWQHVVYRPSHPGVPYIITNNKREFISFDGVDFGDVDGDA